jgi:superfamily II RNA helicase
MTGRAGRRGKDKIGFALIIPGLYQDPQLISDLIKSPPEPIKSQIRITFSMVLNLLLSHSIEAIHDLLHLSFGAFQERRRSPGLEWRLMKIKKELEHLLPDGLCKTHDPVEVLSRIEKYQEIMDKIATFRRKERKSSIEKKLLSLLKPGRLFIHKNRALYVAFKTLHERERTYCLAQKLTVKALRRKKGIRAKKVPIENIQEIFDYIIDLPDDVTVTDLNTLMQDIPFDKLRPLDIWKNDSQEKEIEIMEEYLRSLPCYRCPDRRKCKGLISYLKKVSSDIQMVKERLWRDFNRHIEFLRHTGFVDCEWKLTPDGIWASQLRLDEPLLIAEAIRKGAFTDKEPAIIAALVAPFVADKLKDIPINQFEMDGMEELREAFEGMIRKIEGLLRLKESWGFDTPVIQYWPSVAIYLWAKGKSWEDLLRSVPLEEGDMVSLIVRTADNLRQISSLERTHPDIAKNARVSISLIQREPAFIPY